MVALLRSLFKHTAATDRGECWVYLLPAILTQITLPSNGNARKLSSCHELVIARVT